MWAWGPFSPTASKTDTGKPVTLDTLRAVKAAISIPVVAIGGITAERAGDIIAAGADGVAVISAVVGAPRCETGGPAAGGGRPGGEGKEKIVVGRFGFGTRKGVGEMLPKALTIAGSDSGGGAGIQADLKTFAALGVYGASVITAVTAQNTLGVTGVHNLPPEFVAQQLEAVLSDIGADAAKIGMLANADIIGAVADKVQEHGLKKLVLDPVMVAKSGDHLLAPEAREALKERLLPLALVVTPNIHEAEVLTGMGISDLADMEKAARVLHSYGTPYVIVKGGHLEGWPPMFSSMAVSFITSRGSGL